MVPRIFTSLRPALVALLLSGTALAQTPQVADPMQAQTVTGRPRPELDPVGLRLGGFRLDAMGEVRPGYDSNLLGQSGRAAASAYGGTAGAASLNSGWSQHGLGASAQVAAQNYARRGELSWHDYNMGGFGRYDLVDGGSLEARYRHHREHLDVYSVDVQGAGIARPVPFVSDEASLAATTRRNRYQLLGGASYRTYRYEDLRAGGVLTPLSRQSFDAASAFVAGAYEVSPGRHLTLRGAVQEISHTDASARGRDSLTWETTAGVKHDFDGVWQARAAFGWRHRDYQDTRLKPLAGPAFDATLTWLPSGLTTVSLTVARSIEESIQPNAVAYTRSLAQARVDHELLRNLLLFAELGLDHRGYQTTRQYATDLRISLGPRWMLNRRLTLSASYTHLQRLWANSRSMEFGRDLVEMRLRLAL